MLHVSEMLGKVLASPRFCEGGWGEGFGVEESAFRVLSVSLSLYVCVCVRVCEGGMFQSSASRSSGREAFSASTSSRCFSLTDGCR